MVLSETRGLAIIIILFSLFSCSRPDNEKKFFIGFSQCCNDLWRDMMEQEMLMELSFHPEIKFEMKVADNDSKVQIEQIRELIDKGIDVLIVAPNETGPLTAIIEEIYDKEIPVFVMDRKINSDKYTSFISADNYEIGKTAGEYIISRFQDGGKVLELQISMSISPAMERSRGFRDALAKYPKLALVDAVQTEGNTQKLEQELPSIIEQHPEVKIIFCHTDFICQTASKILEAKGKGEGFFYLGVDGIPGNDGGLQAIEDGMLSATLLYPSGGTEAIQGAIDYWNNRTIEKNKILQTTVIDERNVRIMKLQTNKILNQQKNIERQQEKLKEQQEMYKSQKNILYAVLGLLTMILVLTTLVFKTLQARNEALKSLKRKNLEVEQQRNEIYEISEKAKAANQSKLEFFTNISHEFRTPLTLILGTIDSLLKSTGLKRKEDKDDISLMRKNALRLLRLINQLMDIRKIDNKQMRIQATENDLIAFVKEITRAYQKVAENRNIDFRCYYKEENMLVWFDMNMVDKVLFNLLSNAFKFTEDGGKIHVSIDKNTFDNMAIIIVEDDGKGMPKEHVENAFQRFYQGELYHTKGTGLGLSLSKDLVELHHGKINLQSTLGKGTRFEILLPLGKKHFKENQIFKGVPDFTTYEDLPLIEEKIESVEDSNPYPKEYTLLVIEDNEELQYFLNKKLGKTFDIQQANNAAEGAEKAKSLMPDLIICDVNLPEQDGLSLTHHLKSDLQTSHIPVILLTALTSAEQKIEGIKTGADAYLTKPFNLTFLEENIKSLLRNREILKEQFGEGRLLKEKTLSGISKVDSQFLQQFVRFVNQNYGQQDFGMTQLVKEFSLSRTQLYRKIKALLGQTVAEYIQEVRLKRAKDLLQDEELTIAEIAYKVGYTSPSYFSTAFKTKFDCTPSQFRTK